MSYNGWSNYETWNVALWLGNDQASHEWANEQAREAWENPPDHSLPFDMRDRAILALSDVLKEAVEEQNPLADEANTYSDLLGAAISEVNFYEIAEHYIDDNEPEPNPED